MSSEPHPDLFGDETPIIGGGSDRGNAPASRSPFCKNCERPGVCGSENECLKPCIICGGEGTVDGRDYYDPMWDYEKYNDPFTTCTSCGGTGLAKDMSYC